MTAYKRFIIPLRSAVGAGGRCLAERLRDGSLRITLMVKNIGKKPLDLWLFDKDKAYRYPKTLYADRTGNIVLRQAIKDAGLSEVRCACLIDDARQPEIVGYCGEKVDWQNILLHSGTPETAEETAHMTEESFKRQVKELVAELDDRLRPAETESRPQSPYIPDGLNWQKIGLKELAGNKRLCNYARNPFVAAECKKYEHLLLAENDKFYFLAVPCEPRDRFTGRSQGFRIFTDCNGMNCCILKCEK